jgi:GntR family transcriptional regulator, transcriptional repressor for pyruvate dehydrogenase complex
VTLTSPAKPGAVGVARPKPVRRQKMAVAVAEAIAEDMFSRGVPPGSVLATEAQMINQFQVGRATLREALRLLEAEGLIAVRAGPNGGAVVQQPSPDRLARLLSIMLVVSGTSLREVLEARQVLEPELARRAAINAVDADVERLFDACDRSAKAADNVREFMEAMAEFHSALADASGNKALSAFWFAVRRVVEVFESGVHHSPDSIDGSLRAHRRIAEAIRKRDSEGAALAMRRHMAAHLRYLESEHPQVLISIVRPLEMDA